ncbi:MAG: hypothetical protein V3U43_04130 [Pseudomonadales bacterium]
MGLKRRRDDEQFMITLDQVQQMVEVMANAVKRLREQAEMRLAEDRERDESDTEMASDDSSVVH